MDINLNKVLLFQVERDAMNLAKHCLFLLEEQRDYALKLEKIIKEMGVDNLDLANEKYAKSRKRVLTLANSSVRELESLLDKTTNLK